MLATLILIASMPTNVPLPDAYVDLFYDREANLIISYHECKETRQCDDLAVARWEMKDYIFVTSAICGKDYTLRISTHGAPVCRLKETKHETHKEFNYP